MSDSRAAGQRPHPQAVRCGIDQRTPAGESDCGHANDELLIVLSGTPELRTRDGLRALQPGEVVSFPRGAEGAHRLRNASAEPCRLLLISEMNFPAVVDYPDTGTMLVVTAPTDRLAFPSGSDGPSPDLIAAAFAADPSSAS